MTTDAIPKSLEDAIVGSIELPNLSDLAADFGEIALDSVLDDGFVKDLPVIGWIPKILGAQRDIRNLIFANKLYRFLFQLGQVPRQEREEFARKLNRDPEFKQQAVSQLILTLERLDEFEKSELVARAFSLYILGRIDYAKYREFVSAIDRCFLNDLGYLRTGKINTSEVDSTIPVRLTAAGLVEVESIPQIRAAEAQNRYRCTSLGELFRELLFPST